MIKSIFFKEWIKTRRCYAVVCLAMFGFVGYCMLNVNRVAEIKGAPHLWEVMILKDAVFLDIFKYVPTFLGILFGLMQFVPEMQNRCLKLTLHLPYSNHRMLAVMQLFGLALLAACFALSVLMIVLVYARIFVPEMVAAVVHGRPRGLPAHRLRLPRIHVAAAAGLSGNVAADAPHLPVRRIGAGLRLRPPLAGCLHCNDVHAPLCQRGTIQRRMSGLKMNYYAKNK